MRERDPNHHFSSTEELGLLVEAVQDYAIFLLSPEGVIRSWNGGAVRIMGYDEEEAVGRNFSIFYGPEDLEKRKPQYELETAEREGRVEDEGWRVRKDGTRFWANTIITALRDDSGTLRGFAKITRDMSERRRAMEELRQSNEIFQLLVSNVREYAIFMLDTTGHVATWNAGAERIKGYTPDEIVGKHFSLFYTEEDRAAGKPERKLQTAREKGWVEDEGWRVRKDGTRFWANVVVTAVYDSHGELRGFAKITRDLTERKQAEETQKALLEQREARLQAEDERRRAEASYRVAQEANKAKDEFLMTLSHELRTPMTAILGWARLLPTMAPDEPMFREAVSSIARGAQLQARLIDDILDVSRIVSGKLRLSPENVEVARVIMTAVDAVSPTADAKGIEIRSTMSPGLGSVVVDSTRLHQVIWNLLSNAVKFTPRGGLVEVLARRTSSHVQITVRDNGEGIDAQFLPHMFEPFRQAELPHTRVHGGLGLGLSIVRYIAEAHGGTVSAESAGRGKGAEFTVTLPIRAMTSQDNKQPREQFQYRDRLRGVDMVLVEDDREAREMITAVLRAAGATVNAYDSAHLALNALKDHRPELLITDIAMPEVDGYAFTRTLRERGWVGDMKIIALSAFPAGAEPTGFDAYLTKPIDPFKLVEDVARVVSRANA